MNMVPQGVGWVEVICGSMFSGKTEELLRRVKRAQIARQVVQVFKPKLDDRYHKTDVVSHGGGSAPATTVEGAPEILELVKPETRVVGIDEAQFFDNNLVDICEELADRGVRVIVAGLDQDYRGRPFGPMPRLLCVAEYVTKSLAICMVCGNPANRTYRISGGKRTIEVGAADRYEARCRKCFKEPVHAEEHQATS